MGLSRARSDSNKGKNQNQIQSLPNRDKLSLRNSFFGTSSDFDILAWLRGVALDPCNPQASHSSVRKLHIQALKTRKVLLMCNAKCPRKKRKFELFLKGNNSTAFSGPFEDKPNTKSAKKVSGTSSVTNSLNSSKGTSSSYPPVASLLGYGGVMTVEDNFNGKHANVSLACSDDLAQMSDSLSSGVYMAPQQAVEMLMTTGECPPRAFIPIGPRFQADIPEWSGKSSPEALRWLGTQCWPGKGASVDRNDDRAVGRGKRPKSCSCLSPGSAECARRHISEARHRLRSDLGQAFLTWKFDEMGETVSSSWTPHEEETFEALAKAYPPSGEADFWKHVVESFPEKRKKSLVGYYYNVFIPRRMSVETRSSIPREQLVSDDDMAESDGGEQDEEEHGNVRRLLRSGKR